MVEFGKIWSRIKDCNTSDQAEVEAYIDSVVLKKIRSKIE